MKVVKAITVSDLVYTTLSIHETFHNNVVYHHKRYPQKVRQWMDNQGSPKNICTNKAKKAAQLLICWLGSVKTVQKQTSVEESCATHAVVTNTNTRCPGRNTFTEKRTRHQLVNELRVWLHWFWLFTSLLGTKNHHYSIIVLCILMQNKSSIEEQKTAKKKQNVVEKLLKNIGKKEDKKGKLQNGKNRILHMCTW